MPKTDDKALSLEALSRSMADPTPRPLVGTKAKPGIFVGGTAAIKACAQRAVEQGWIEPSGGWEGQGRTRKPLYRITTAGIVYVLEHGQNAAMLRDMLGALDGQGKRLERIQAEVSDAANLSRAQAQAVRELLTRLAPPDVAELVRKATTAQQPAALSAPPAANTAWPAEALKYLAEYRRRTPSGRCPLPELFQKTAATKGLSIGQFHDGVRLLAAGGKITLHPFTGAAYQLRDEQYALVIGQEIKYYVELASGN